MNLIQEAKKAQVSVVIPCYNQGRYLYDCLTSILMNTDVCTEIVVVDDGSTDMRTRVELDKAKIIPNVKVITQPNQGLSSARNTGLENCSGEYIQFLDSDDLVLPNKFSLQIAHIKTTGADVSISNYFTSDEVVLDLNLHNTILKYPFTLKSFLYNWERGFSIPIHCGLFKRECLPFPCFPVDFYSKEDWLFWVKLMLKDAKLAYIDMPLAVYRLHGNNMTKSKQKMGKSWIDAAQFITSILPEKEKNNFFRSATEWYDSYYCKQDECFSREQNKSTNKDISSTYLLDTTHPKIEKNCWIANGCVAEGPYDGRHKNTKYTIIVPVYNHYDYLERCIESACIQSYDAPHYVLAFNDMSSDHRVELLLTSLTKKYSNFSFYNSSSNNGVSCAQNFLIMAATSRYVAFLDCDDYLDYYALQYVEEELIKDDTVDYLFTNRFNIDEKGALVSSFSYFDIRDHYFEDHYTSLLLSMYASHLKVISKTALVKAGLCSADFTGVQDYELALKISSFGKVKGINKFLYFHRIHGNSVTSVDNASQIRKANIVRRSSIIETLNPNKSTSVDSVLLLILRHIRQNKNIMSRKNILYCHFDDTNKGFIADENFRTDLSLSCIVLIDIATDHFILNLCKSYNVPIVLIVTKNSREAQLFARDYNAFFDVIVTFDECVYISIVVTMYDPKNLRLFCLYTDDKSN